jgi:hypothetical protein
MEHTRLDFLRRQLGNIEQWQDFRLRVGTANTPQCGGFGIRSVPREVKRMPNPKPHWQYYFLVPFSI